jgi:hypothetical protein
MTTTTRATIGQAPSTGHAGRSDTQMASSLLPLRDCLVETGKPPEAAAPQADPRATMRG